MSLLEVLVQRATQLGASDLHLEPGLPPSVRVNGALRPLDPAPVGRELTGEAAALLPGEAWNDFLERRSADLARTIAGVRCRVSVLHSARGVGMAVRLLHPFQATLETLNLHPDLMRLVARPHGLVVVSGPTGSGKSSTIAALVEELNRAKALHVITLEQPIEHAFRPKCAFIRQREVGRDTPSFHQGLMDALREDPDVLVVGEVREPDTIRLALSAAETGHLVITTLHAGNAAEALARIVGSFAPEAQPAVAASLAESLVGVISQRLVYRAELGVRLPECEVLVSNEAVRATVRQSAFARLQSIVQMGANDGMWTFERWRRWQESRDRYFVRARDAAREPLPEEAAIEPISHAAPTRAPYPEAPAALPRAPTPQRRAPASPRVATDGVLELDGVHEDLASILKELD